MRILSGGIDKIPEVYKAVCTISIQEIYRSAGCLHITMTVSQQTDALYRDIQIAHLAESHCRI